MVLESMITPFKAEQRPSKLLLLGILFTSVSIFLGLWIFKAQTSLVMVFFTAMAALPLIYNTLRMEEEKDLEGMEEKWLLKEHSKALRVFMYLFIGATIAFSFWYVVFSSDLVNTAFQAQTATINAINSRVTGNLSFNANMGFFSKIFLNNVKVLIFCILFSFVYGSGAIFILMWNASVIGTAIGNFIRSEIAQVAQLVGFEKIAHYFQIISIGLLRYSIHGIPEILAYFMGGLAGGIIGLAVIKHDFGTAKFEHILLDSADVLLLSLGVLFIAAVLEVFITPAIF
ncbi:MAG TPA: stage II sporulation protein M [Candidatus Nanoarchaeia archaeon]|nr:stage II sporulation protein M [Candidatus Nanoarchaeia archaeon]